MTSIFPASPVDTDILRAALEHVLCAYYGSKRTVKALERRACAYGSSYPLEELDVTLDNHTRLEIIFKDLSPEARLEDTRWIKPAFLYDINREAEVYRTLLTPARLGTATYYGAITSCKMKQSWLFIERVPGCPLWQVGELGVWKAAARWLARMHIRLGEEKRNASSTPIKWLYYDEPFYKRWMQRAVRVVQRKEPDAMHLLQKLVTCYDLLVERLRTLPQGFIHGEFYASNVLVQQGRDALRICPVDWEMAAVGPVLMDLSALTSGTWTRQEQVAMVTAYQEALHAEQGRVVDLEGLLQGMDACHLFQAIQWVGWSLRWEPPPEHARNWLIQAINGAQNLFPSHFRA